MANPLFDAVRARDHARVAELLRQSPESATQRDADGATALHYAAELGDRESVTLLLDAGADVNARDTRFHATPAGWAIEYLRRRGALLGTEIEDARRAIETRDHALLERYLTRFPTLRAAADREGTPLATHARNSGDAELARLFGGDGL
ncbi:MAG TPA: ankyrin repeat domain-containing protein [Thermoanaerobaculia bacterium]|jgi:hypothetical protein|nr:ankyrin repeat domain-containing protein [Thermoanaerobaculia bacterium]